MPDIIPFDKKSEQEFMAQKSERYIIQENGNGVVTLTRVSSGRVELIEPLQKGFGFGDADELALELAAVVISDHLETVIRPVDMIIGDHPVVILSNSFMWAFLMGDGPIEITHEQINNYLEVRNV